MDAPPLLDVERRRVDIERLTEGVPDMALGDLTYRHRDGTARIAHRGTADKAVSGLHRDRAHHVVADVLGNLEGEHAGASALLALIEGHVDVERIEELRHGLHRKLHVDDRSGDTCDATDPGRLTGVGGRRFGRGGHAVLFPWLRVLRGGERVGAADDLADLLGDLGLPCLVGLAGEGADELFGVVGGRLHGPATGGVL